MNRVGNVNRGGRGGSARRGVAEDHPARRVARVFGYGALAGVALFVLCIPLGLVVSLFDVDHPSPVVLVPLFLSAFLAGVGWLMWGSWSATLNQYSAPLNTTAKLTLAATPVLLLGVLFFLGAWAPLLLYVDTDPPDSLLPVVIVLAGVGVLLVAGTILGAAVYGGIALGGPRYWWVGTLLSVGLVGSATGLALGEVAVTVLGVAALIVSCFGYRRALVSGLEQGRSDAVEAEGHRRRTG